MDYFKPLRRKIGVFTLLVACVVSVGWMRSLARRDSISFGPMLVTSNAGAMTVLRKNFRNARPSNAPTPLFQWSSYVADARQNPLIGRKFEKPDDYWTAYAVDWQTNGAGFHFGMGRKNSWPDHWRVYLTVVPYYSIVIPLTLFSAWLLLSKPQPKSRPAHG